MQSLEFSRPEYRSRLPFPSPRDLPDPGIEPRSPALQVDFLPAEPPGKPRISRYYSKYWKSLQTPFFCFFPLTLIFKFCISQLTFLFCIGQFILGYRSINFCHHFRWTVKGLSHTYTCILSYPNSPPIQAATWHWAEFPLLYSRSLLVTHFKYSNVYTTFPKSLTVPFPQ